MVWLCRHDSDGANWEAFERFDFGKPSRETVFRGWVPRVQGAFGEAGRSQALISPESIPKYPISLCSPIDWAETGLRELFLLKNVNGYDPPSIKPLRCLRKTHRRLQAVSEMWHIPVFLLPVCAGEGSKLVSSEVPDVWWRNDLEKKGLLGLWVSNL